MSDIFCPNNSSSHDESCLMKPRFGRTVGQHFRRWSQAAWKKWWCHPNFSSAYLYSIFKWSSLCKHFMCDFQQIHVCLHTIVGSTDNCYFNSNILGFFLTKLLLTITSKCWIYMMPEEVVVKSDKFRSETNILTFNLMVPNSLQDSVINPSYSMD